MSKFIILIFSYCCLIMFPAFADETLDTLFANLKKAPSQTEARKLETLIWKKWFKSGNPDIDELMQLALKKRSGYDFNGAVEILDTVINLRPDYAEAWNQRATVYFFQEKYEESLVDIAQALELEPRHFGSLAGRAMIRLRQHKNAIARQNIAEAIKIHPYLKERSLFPGL